MPTYEYECQQCGHTFERFQNITESPVRKCPECGRNRVKRLLGSGAGLIFKGNGFYQTDYRSPAFKEAAKAESGAGGSAGSDKPAAD
jgi:putative FmdB family regulatory protein